MRLQMTYSENQQNNHISQNKPKMEQIKVLRFLKLLKLNNLENGLIFITEN